MASLILSLILVPSSLAAQSIFNVKDYGASGDDTGNDGPAIQAAIDAAAEGGGMVHFPSGTYRMTSGVSVPGGVTLEGVGWNLSNIPDNRGSWLHVTAVGFVPITLRGHGSSVRRLAFVHPQPEVPESSEDDRRCSPCAWAPVDYPFALEIDGTGVLIQDVFLRSATHGVRQTGGSGLSIDRLTGQVFRTGIAIDSSSGAALIADVSFVTSFSGAESVKEFSLQNLTAIELSDNQGTTLTNVSIFRAQNGLALREGNPGTTRHLQVTNFDCDRCEAGILVAADGAAGTFSNLDLKGDDFLQDESGVRVDAEDTFLQLANVHINRVGRSAIRVDGTGSRLQVDGLWVRDWSQATGTSFPAFEIGQGARLKVGFTRLLGAPGGPISGGAGTVLLDP